MSVRGEHLWRVHFDAAGHMLVGPARVTDEMVERAWRTYHGLADDESPTPGASLDGFRAALEAALDARLAQVCSCCGRPMDTHGCWIDTDDPTGETWHHSAPCSAKTESENADG